MTSDGVSGNGGNGGNIGGRFGRDLIAKGWSGIWFMICSHLTDGKICEHWHCQCQCASL